MRCSIISSCLLLLACLSSSFASANNNKGYATQKCAPRVVDAKEEKIVCVCNATYCDDLIFSWPTVPGAGRLIQTTKAGLRFEEVILPVSHGHSDTNSTRPNATLIDIDVTRQRQSIMGFGGAFTDAAGLNIVSLPEDARQKLMESYFGKHGARYNFGRVVISGADFSTRPYSYDDMPAGSSDFNLTNWSLAPEDHKYKIPLIKAANEIVSKWNRTLSLFGSSWSPPAFMKTSKSLVRGHLIDKAQVYRSYAQYLVRFYEAYKAEGIKFWGGTVQNEPSTSDGITYNFNSLQLSAEQAVKFVAGYLGPALAAKGYTKDKFKLMVNDDNIDTFNDQVPIILANKDVQKYVAGLAFHWYNSGRIPYDVIDECYDKVKDKVEFVLMTEACVEPGLFGKPVDLGSWERGERYAADIIQDLWRHAGGWIDWNLALDEKGGPNWVSNFVDSPVIVNKDKGEFFKQPMYYVLTHFSRFFVPGSMVIDLGSSGMSADKQLMAVAVLKKTTQHLVVNILNKSKEDRMVTIKAQELSWDVKILGMSMNSVVLKLKD